ncbi:chondroadherin [Aethina tumida]|uniref:chondroadherin n=1 Tax=Aethina tumida TaxID=116153 RepID=UPI00214970F6|nr:chondroadherin [Aethina tumida]
MSVAVVCLLLVHFAVGLDDCNDFYFKNAEKSYERCRGYQERDVMKEEQDVMIWYLKVTGKDVKHLCKGSLGTTVLDADLSNIGASYLEERWLKNSTVKVLNLTGNSLVILQRNAFDNMPHLEAIYLDDNKLAVWESDWFKNCPMLHLISVNNNYISELPENAMQNVPYEVKKYLWKLLPKIYLNNNNLKYIHDKAFSCLKYMSTLSLKNNKLFEISSKTFGDVDYLFTLDVSGNNFICFSSNAMKSLTNVRLLIIKDNVLNEDCKNNLKVYFEQKMDDLDI